MCFCASGAGVLLAAQLQRVPVTEQSSQRCKTRLATFRLLNQSVGVLLAAQLQRVPVTEQSSQQCRSRLVPFSL
jgi:hypothetical protein